MTRIPEITPFQVVAMLISPMLFIVRVQALGEA